MYFDFGMLVYVLIWENRIARADRSVLGNRTFTFSKTDFLIRNQSFAVGKPLAEFAGAAS